MLSPLKDSIAATMATTTKETVSEEVRKREGQALRSLIEQSGKGQPTIAQQAGLGTKAYLSQLCTGHRPINADAAARLARVLNTMIDEFSPRLASAVREASLFVRDSAYPARAESKHMASDITRPWAQPPSTDAKAWPFTVPVEKMLTCLWPADIARIDGYIMGVVQSRESSQSHLKSSNGYT